MADKNNNSVFMTVLRKEWEVALEKSRKFDALRDAGVDNWEGYSIAMEEYYKEYPQE